MVITDGMKLRLGDTELTFVETPGHSPGTISTLVPLKDGNDSLVGGMLGGSAFDKPWVPTQTYLGSIEKWRDAARQAHADVPMSNHPTFDLVLNRAALLRSHKLGEPHPFVIGVEGYQRFMSIYENCARAYWADGTPLPTLAR